METSKLDDRIPELLARVDLVAEVEARGGVLARQSGGTSTFHCPRPDHPDRTPSFTVKDGRWRCWSACDAGGDAIDLVVWLEGCTKGEAIDRLAAAHGLPREAPQSTKSRRTQQQTAILPPETAERLLTGFLAERSWPHDVAEEVGLHVVVDRTGRPRVRFPFPTVDGLTWHQDRVIANGTPKWLSPTGTTPWPFEAQRLQRARQPGYTGGVFVLEGLTDVVSLLSDFPDAVAVGIPGAGALKPSWAAAFAGLRLFVIADNDPAGKKLREKVDAILGPVAEVVWQLYVPAGFGDLDEWRRADPGAFPGALLQACADLDTQETAAA